MANPTGTNTTSPRPSGHGPGPAALVPVLVLTALCSVGTGTVQTGIFFLLRSAFGFGTRENFFFGLVLYASYIAGALTIGPMLRRRTGVDRATRKGPFARWSTRGVLAATILAQAALSVLPFTVSIVQGGGTPPIWTMWTVGLGFGVLTGMMWPIVESYLSGGRTGSSLRAATGRFNVVWSIAVVSAFWLMAPLLRDWPIVIITLLGAFQTLSVVCLLWIAPEPARHLTTRSEPHPPSWGVLLVRFRVLLPLAYMLSGVLSPLLPSVIDRLGVEAQWMTPIASAWVTTRVFVFILFERWHGWHGTAWMPWLAGFCLFAGFAGTVLVPSSMGASVLIAMLGLFGIGNAVAYVGALYYAMELGDAEVDAGGTHEALIGAGYGAGPMLGIVAVMASGGAQGARFEGLLIGLLGVVVCIALVWGIRITRTKRDR